MRALINRPTTLRFTLTDFDGNPVDTDDATSVTVTVEDGDGDAVVTDADASDVGTGEYEYVLAPQSTMDTYTVTWSATLDGHGVEESEDLELVGTRLVPLHEVRAALSDEAADWHGPGPDDAVVHNVALEVEDWLADALNWVPFIRTSRVEWRVRRNTRRYVEIPGILYPREILSLSNDSESAPDIADLTMDPPFVRADADEFVADRYEVHVEHGREPPRDLVAAAIRLAEHVSDETNLPGRASTVSTPDGGVISLALPSPQRPTGLADVDGVVRRLSIPQPVA